MLSQSFSHCRTLRAGMLRWRYCSCIVISFVRLAEQLFWPPSTNQILGNILVASTRLIGEKGQSATNWGNGEKSDNFLCNWSLQSTAFPHLELAPGQQTNVMCSCSDCGRATLRAHHPFPKVEIDIHVEPGPHEPSAAFPACPAPAASAGPVHKDGTSGPRQLHQRINV